MRIIGQDRSTEPYHVSPTTVVRILNFFFSSFYFGSNPINININIHIHINTSLVAHKWRNNRILSFKYTLQRTVCESIDTTVVVVVVVFLTLTDPLRIQPWSQDRRNQVRTRRLLSSGALVRMGDHRLPKRMHGHHIYLVVACGSTG